MMRHWARGGDGSGQPHAHASLWPGWPMMLIRGPQEVTSLQLRLDRPHTPLWNAYRGQSHGHMEPRTAHALQETEEGARIGERA